MVLSACFHYRLAVAYTGTIAATVGTWARHGAGPVDRENEMKAKRLATDYLQIG